MDNIEVEKPRKVPPFRDTVPVRISRKLRDEVGVFKGKYHKTLSKMVDEAISDYILSLKRRMDY